MKKLTLSLVTLCFFSATTVFANNNAVTKNKKEAKVKKHCPNRPGCTCH